MTFSVANFNGTGDELWRQAWPSTPDKTSMKSRCRGTTLAQPLGFGLLDHIQLLCMCRRNSPQCNDVNRVHQINLMLFEKSPTHLTARQRVNALDLVAEPVC